MMRQRNIVRFLVAPPLFGKTALATEYAESIFSFENVFWVSAKSPCFLRDLDRKLIASFLVKKNLKPALAVFEDIPLLDKKRAEALSVLFDELLKHGWEVIATMTPRCDVYEGLQPDGIRIRAQEFLLTDAEIDVGRTDVKKLQRPASSFLPTERIAGLFWGGQDADGLFCMAIANEELAIDEQLVIFIMLVLGYGRLGDLAVFVKGWDAGLLEVLRDDYAYLGIDVYREEFSSCIFTLDQLVKAFMPQLDAMAAHSNFGEKGILTHRLADLLVLSGDSERACGLVLRTCPPRQRTTWLNERSGQLFQKGCFLPPHLLFESIRSAGQNPGNRLSAFEAWRIALLGDEARALRIAMKLYLMTEADSGTRIIASLLLFRFGNKTQAHKAITVLEGLVRYRAEPGRDWYDHNNAETLVKQEPFWKALAQSQICLSHAKADTTNFVEALRLAGANRDMLSLVLAWLIEDLNVLGEASASDEESQQMATQIRYIATYIERRSQEEDIGFFDMLLLAKWERLSLAQSPENRVFVPRSLLTFAHDMELNLFNQQSMYRRLRQEAETKQSDFRRTHPNEYRVDAQDAARKAESTPMLFVKLFGGLEVRIGDKLLNPRLFSRQKIKTLLALLVLNHGKEFSRERLCKVLWPESDPAASKRNLYSIWSQLKKALSGQDGRCPYLIHTQFSYKLDGHLSSSDVAQFDALCRRLLFSFSDLELWSQVFSELEDLYTDDLLPTETENRSIISARADYRSRLVDTLSTAAHRLFEAGEYQNSLWFSRAAIARDAAREDIYTLLMQAQIALGQRAAALETYFRCRRYLVEELGIDPSEKTTRLYCSIIAEEPGFKLHDSLSLVKG